MNIEYQVVSLELSNKLKELNVNTESYFAWFNNPFKERWEVSFQTTNKLGLSAFTSSELMELLPNRITLKKNEPFNSFTLYIKKSFIIVDDNIYNPRSTYSINYECDSASCSGEDAYLIRKLFLHNIWDENFSNALAKTLIYIIENKLICITN